jgi:hypothetical protein
MKNSPINTVKHIVNIVVRVELIIYFICNYLFSNVFLMINYKSIKKAIDGSDKVKANYKSFWSKSF